MTIFLICGTIPVQLRKYINGANLSSSPKDKAINIKIEVFDGTEWRPNPSGIDNAIKSLFPEPIQIGAMENAEEDVSKPKAGTTIAKLLAEIIGPIETQYGTEVKEALTRVKGLLSADGDARVEELTNFDTQVNSKIDSFFRIASCHKRKD